MGNIFNNFKYWVIVNHKELFIKALETLFFSGGSDASVEIFWGANDLLDYYEAVNNVKITRFKRDNKTYEDNITDVFEEIRSK